MTKYLVLYRAGVSATDQMANATPEQAQAGLDAWNTWAGEAGSAVIDLGAPLAPAAIVGAGAGAAADPLGGYSVMQADSIDALRALLQRHPHLMLPGASIEVHEFLSMPGMG